MPLLSVNSLRTAKAILSTELLAYSFHTSSSLYAKGALKPRGTSRTRLAKDLKPRKPFGPGKAASLDVAPRKTFQRDPVPHSEAKDIYGAIEKSREFRKTRQESRERREQGSWRGESSRRGSWDKPRDGDSGPRIPSSLRLSPREPYKQPRKPRKPAVEVTDEFSRSSLQTVPTNPDARFTSPPLMEGLLRSVNEILGEDAAPTPIQELSLKNLFSRPEGEWTQHLLASETGSGKSLAYMLPMLHDLKTTELAHGGNIPEGTPSDGKKRLYNPRAIVLAPTHELSRQLSKTAKALLHNIKMRTICASDANKQLRQGLTNHKVSAAKMSTQYATMSNDTSGPAQFQDKTRSIDVLVSTPNKLLEMVRGHGWNWAPAKAAQEGEKNTFVVGEPEVGLQRVEWVVIDEADVMFDPDFLEETQALLADIAAARGQPVPAPVSDAATPATYNYPFNLVLTSATIPNSLASYLDNHHPNLVRLASPNLHKLPATLKMEHAAWTGGNRVADIEHKIQHIWWQDKQSGKRRPSKVLVFCNKSTAVESLGKDLEEKGVKNIALTSTAEVRKKGNSHHLSGFLLEPLEPRPSEANQNKVSSKEEASETEEEAPNVLITTSLLSRGLDFHPKINNVLIIDPPRNMIDFLHRAGRTGRAGKRGTVIVFGKAKGRGSEVHKELKTKVRALRH